MELLVRVAKQKEGLWGFVVHSSEIWINSLTIMAEICRGNNDWLKQNVVQEDQLVCTKFQVASYILDELE